MLTVVPSYLQNTGVTSRSHLDYGEFAFVLELFPVFKPKLQIAVSVSQTTCGPLQVPQPSGSKRNYTSSLAFLGALEDNELQFEGQTSS